MPDITTTTAVAVTTAGVAGAAITGTGMAFGIPLPVIVCAVLGALIAVSRGERVAMTVGGLWSAMLAFALALAFGVFGGPFAGAFLERGIEKLLGFSMSGLGADALCALLLSLLGQTVILPAIGKRLGVEIEHRGARS